MKLEKILEKLGVLDKNAFLKIIDTIISNNPRNIKQIDKILSDQKRDLKGVESSNIAEILALIEEEFQEYIYSEFLNITSQLDILTDILIRDGNSIIQTDWFARLYDTEIKEINKKTKDFAKNLESESSDLSSHRIRDYKIYKSCLKTAFVNDEIKNQESKITWDEQTILNTLSSELSLSHEELKLINNLIIKVKPKSIHDVINELKSVGVIFYSKRNNTVYVADEVVKILRKIRGRDVADKHFRRVLRIIKPSQLNLICRAHNIAWKGESDEDKIKEIINSGVSLRKVLENSIHKDGTNLTEKKKIITELGEKGLKMKGSLKGSLLEDKISSLIEYFEKLEQDERIGISIDGYESLLTDLARFVPKANDKLKSEFQLQNENVLNHELLMDYNIKPLDVIELLSADEIMEFCKAKEIKTRGDVVDNILDSYRDSENLYIENFVNIGFRNLQALKENGVNIKEASLGVKFEEVTKKIFKDLGYEVDEKLRKSVNSPKNQMDILLKIKDDEVILVECKTIKESGYNKFSAVSRQLKSYSSEIEKKGFKVIKSLLIAPDFSDDFISDCNLNYEINLSLIKATTLLKVYNGFKKIKLKEFPHNLLMRDTLIDEERILKALSK